MTISPPPERSPAITVGQVSTQGSGFSWPWVQWFQQLAARFNALSSQVATIPTGPIVAHTAFTSTVGNFTVAHGLRYSPSYAEIALTSLAGNVVWQVTRWDSVNFYLQGSGGGVTGFVDSIR